MGITKPQPVAVAAADTPSEQYLNDSQFSTNVKSKPDSSHEESSEPSLQAGFDTSDFPSAVPLFFITVALLLAMFANNLDTTIITTAIPQIADDFHSLDEVGWYGSAFFLTVGSFQPIWGKSYKYFPLKFVFLLAILVLEIGSLICALAQDGPTFVFGRALSGAGAAGMASGAFSLIAFTAPSRHQPAYMGIMGATYGLAALAGPLLGDAFTENSSWCRCFWISLPIGGVAAAIIFFFFKPPAASKPVQAPLSEKIWQMDLSGTAIILGAAICFLLAFQWGGVSKAWSDSDVIGTLVGAVLLTGFVANE